MKNLSQSQESSVEISNANDLVYQAQISRLQGQVEFLTSQNVGYAQTVELLTNKLEEKDKKIMHLEDMLRSTTPEIGTASPFLVSDEEYILTMVIKDLKEAAQVRALTKDEMTKLDLAIKNKRLLSGESTSNDGKAKTPTKTRSTAELVSVAKLPLKG